MNVIDYNTLRRIIAEEVKAAAPKLVREADDSEQSVAEKTKMLKIITEKAGGLLTAIESFEESCPEGCMAPVMSQLSQLKKTLENMANHPGDYLQTRSREIVRSDVDNLRPTQKD